MINMEITRMFRWHMLFQYYGGVLKWNEIKKEIFWISIKITRWFLAKYNLSKCLDEIVSMGDLILFYSNSFFFLVMLKHKRNCLLKHIFLTRKYKTLLINHNCWTIKICVYFVCKRIIGFWTEIYRAYHMSLQSHT